MGRTQHCEFVDRTGNVTDATQHIAQPDSLRRRFAPRNSQVGSALEITTIREVALNSRFTFLAVIALLSIAGCASTQLYDGPSRPSDEVVRITGMSGLDPLGGHTSALVCKIDDKNIDGCAVKVEFLPGTHKLVLKTRSYGTEQGTIEVEREFKAGERYLLGVGVSPGSRKLMPALIPE